MSDIRDVLQHRTSMVVVFVKSSSGRVSSAFVGCHTPATSVDGSNVPVVCAQSAAPSPLAFDVVGSESKSARQ